MAWPTMKVLEPGSEGAPLLSRRMIPALSRST